MGAIGHLAIHHRGGPARRQMAGRARVFVVRAAPLAQIKIKDRLFRSLVNTRGNFKGQGVITIRKMDLIRISASGLVSAEIQFISIREGTVGAAGSWKSRRAENSRT